MNTPTYTNIDEIKARLGIASNPALIDIPTLKTRLGIGGNATVYRRIKDDPRFPRPVKIGKLTRFLDAEVTRYIEHLAENREARAETDPKAT